MNTIINQTTSLVDKVISKIDVPKPNTVDIDNLSARVLVTKNSPDLTVNNKVVGLVRENFSSDNSDLSYNFNWFSMDLLRVVVIIFLLYLIIFNSNYCNKNKK